MTFFFATFSMDALIARVNQNILEELKNKNGCGAKNQKKIFACDPYSPTLIRIES